ncbi:MAG: hypothetical protein F6Q13_17160, partial [Mycobacterium sp.]
MRQTATSSVYSMGMKASSGAMHVARNKRRYVAKSGQERVYETVLLRRSFRDGSQVRHQTLANLSKLGSTDVFVGGIHAALPGSG